MPTIIVYGSQFREEERFRLTAGFIKAMVGIPQMDVVPERVVVHFPEVATHTVDPVRPRQVDIFVYLLHKDGRTRSVIRELQERIGTAVVDECERGTAISIRVSFAHPDDWKLMMVR